MDTIAVVLLFGGLIIGILLGGMGIIMLRRMTFDRQVRTAERKATKMVSDARFEAKSLLDDSKQESQRVKNQTDIDYREKKSEIQREEQKLTQKTETLDRKLEGVDQREKNLTDKEKSVDVGKRG